MPVYQYILSLLEALFLFYIIKIFVQGKLTVNKNDIIVLLFNLFLIGSIPSEYSIIPWFLGQAIYYVYGFFTFKDETFHGLLSVSCMFLFAVIVQFICVLFFSLIPVNLSEDVTALIGNLLTLLVSVCILQIPRIRNLYNNITKAARSYKYIFFNSYLLMLCIILFFKINPHSLTKSIYIIVITLFSVVSINLWLLNYDNKLKLQNIELEHYKKDMPIYKALIDDIRSTQHEYSNRVQNLQFLTQTCKTYEELSNAVMQYTLNDVKVMRAYPLLKINMPMLAASLYSLSLKAGDLGITVRFDITTEDLHCGITEMELSDFATILLQNAIEACSKGDVIYVKIEMLGERLHFEVRNPVPCQVTNKQIQDFFTKGYTTKKWSKDDSLPHGLGLHYLLSSLASDTGVVCAQCICEGSNYYMVFYFEIQ